MRLGTRHDCLPNLLGNGYKSGGKVANEEKKFYIGLTRAAKAGQKSQVPARRAYSKPTKERPISNVHIESPFPSVSKSRTINNSFFLSGVNIDKFMDGVAVEHWPVWQQKSRQSWESESRKQKEKMEEFGILCFLWRAGGFFFFKSRSPLKVPSGQIGSEREWYHWKAFKSTSAAVGF